MAERPLDVIHRSLDKDVLVLLKRGGSEFRGAGSSVMTSI